MPTGYTYDLIKKPDLPFASFAARCARAMGALVMLRDSPITDTLPETAGDDLSYETKALADAEADVERVTTMTAVQWEAAHRKHIEDTRTQNAERAAEAALWREVCGRLSREATAWKPPTPNHVGLQKFMLEQLQTTAEFDAKPYLQPVLSLPEFQAVTVEAARRTLGFRRESMTNATARVNERAAWLAALKASLT